MLNEIAADKIVGLKDVRITFANIARFRQLKVEVDNSFNVESRYGRIDVDWETVNFEEKLYKLTFTCATRFMGTLSVEEMLTASEELRAIALTVESMTSMLEGKVVRA